MGRASHIPLSGWRVGVAGWRVAGLGLVARGVFFRPLDNECAGGAGGCGLLLAPIYLSRAAPPLAFPGCRASWW